MIKKNKPEKDIRSFAGIDKLKSKKKKDKKQTINTEKETKETNQG